MCKVLKWRKYDSKTTLFPLNLDMYIMMEEVRKVDIPLVITPI